ncbi:MAG: hypothetical protein ACOH12_06695 [Parvibaculaceae bacterium]
MIFKTHKIEEDKALPKKLTRENIVEIAKGMVGEKGDGGLPSSKLLQALSDVSAMSKMDIQTIFEDEYRKATGDINRDPFGLVPPIMG